MKAFASVLMMAMLAAAWAADARAPEGEKRVDKRGALGLGYGLAAPAPLLSHGYYGHGLGLYNHGLYGGGLYGHAPYGAGLYGHGLYGGGLYGHGFGAPLAHGGLYGHGLYGGAPLLGHGGFLH